MRKISSSFARWAVHHELDKWAKNGRKANMWWRDDDARAPSFALDRLICLAGRHAAPLTVAIIPDRKLDRLALRLADHDHVTTIQHGTDHVNRSEDPGRPCEFPADFPATQIAARLMAGRYRLAMMPRHLEIVAPPWNNASPNLIAAVKQAGFYGWSAFGRPMGRRDGLAVLDTHLDLLRWKGGGHFRGEGDFYFQLFRLLRARRLEGQWEEPIGLLTHHFQHDAAAWRFLEIFLEEISARRAVRWRGMMELTARHAGQAMLGSADRRRDHQRLGASAWAWAAGR